MCSICHIFEYIHILKIIHFLNIIFFQIEYIQIYYYRIFL
jgi:hypothetical protein